MLDAESQLKNSLCNYGEDFSLSNWEIKLSSPFLTVQSGKGSTTVALHVWCHSLEVQIYAAGLLCVVFSITLSEMKLTVLFDLFTGRATPYQLKLSCWCLKVRALTSVSFLHSFSQLQMLWWYIIAHGFSEGNNFKWILWGDEFWSVKFRS